MRTILTGHQAIEFLQKNSMDENGNPISNKKFANYGGYWREKNNWQAFDFTNGTELYFETFDEPTEALKYASGIMAKTITGMLI